MKKFMTWVLATTLICGASVFTSCSNDDDPEPTDPQQEVKAKLVGKWRLVLHGGKEVVTNRVFINTFTADGIVYSSRYGYLKGVGHDWFFKAPHTYAINGNTMTWWNLDDPTIGYVQDFSINNDELTRTPRTNTDGKPVEDNLTSVFKRISKDFSSVIDDGTIVGLWEGVRLEGEETYGGVEARLDYHADGTYTYYHKDEEGKWVPTIQTNSFYGVDGDWLLMSWTDANGQELIESWDIDDVTSTEMKWSAVREREDGTRFRTTFTWKLVK